MKNEIDGKISQKFFQKILFLLSSGKGICFLLDFVSLRLESLALCGHHLMTMTGTSEVKIHTEDGRSLNTRRKDFPSADSIFMYPPAKSFQICCMWKLALDATHVCAILLCGPWKHKTPVMLLFLAVMRLGANHSNCFLQEANFPRQGIFLYVSVE